MLEKAHLSTVTPLVIDALYNLLYNWLEECYHILARDFDIPGLRSCTAGTADSNDLGIRIPNGECLLNAFEGDRSLF